MKKISRIAGILLAMCLLCFAGCSESKPDNVDREQPPDDGGLPQLDFIGPQQFQMTGLNEKIGVNFTKQAQWGNDWPTHYNVWYGTSPNFDDHTGHQVLPADESNLVRGEITGLTNGTPYFVWINTVYGDIGESKKPYHMETATPVGLPVAPEGVEIKNAYDGQIILEWDKHQWDSTYEVAYNTLPNQTNTTKIITGITKTPGSEKNRYRITGLNPDTWYYVWARSENANGASKYSSYVSDVPKAATSEPENPPNELTLNYGTKRIDATWPDVETASSYKLSWRKAPGVSGSSISALSDAACGAGWQCTTVLPSAGDIVSASITGLENTTYEVKVEACSTAGCVAGSSPVKELAPKPKSSETPIDFNNAAFSLGTAAAEYIFAEHKPVSPFNRGAGEVWDRLVRAKETPIGNLFTDGVLWYLNEYLDKNVDFVFLNSSYIDNSISKGDITVGGLSGAVASASRGNKVTILSMKGSDIKAIRKSLAELSGVSAGDGETLFDEAAYVTHTGSGTGGTGPWAIVSKEVNYTLQYPWPDDVMHMAFLNPPQSLSSAAGEPYYHGIIKEGTLKFKGEDFEDEKVYRIATTDFLSLGADYLILAQKNTGVEDIDIPLWHAVAEYIYDFGTVTPAIDGRIRIQGGPPGGTLGVPEGYNVYFRDNDYYDYYPELR